ncbi:hypothetical protein SDC9_169692 [bioreactor metagenome]|uniref:Uncharacterized protein n=1 Tax=bioreactor metagenome TaxID=1076179 RepID=A0A645G935_9ZZZZ
MYALPVEIFCQLDGRLPAKCHHDPHRLFYRQTAAHIFGRQRLKIQPVGGVIVGRNRFGVVVDDDDLVPHLAQAPHAVHRAVVELDALADAVGAAAQHHDDRTPAAGKAARLARAARTGVKIRGLGVKLGPAGVHHFIAGQKGGQALHPGDAANGIVRVTKLLCL